MNAYLDYDGFGRVLKSISNRFGKYLTAAQSDQKYATKEALDALSARLDDYLTAAQNDQKYETQEALDAVLEQRGYDH